MPDFASLALALRCKGSAEGVAERVHHLAPVVVIARGVAWRRAGVRMSRELAYDRESLSLLDQSGSDPSPAKRVVQIPLTSDSCRLEGRDDEPTGHPGLLPCCDPPLPHVAKEVPCV